MGFASVPDKTPISLLLHLDADFYQTSSLALLSCLRSQLFCLLKTMWQENEMIESRTWGVKADLGKSKTLQRLFGFKKIISFSVIAFICDTDTIYTLFPTFKYLYRK